MQLGDVLDAVKAHLEPEGPVRRGKKPDGTGWQGTAGNSMFVPYTIVYGPDERSDSRLVDVHFDGHVTVQLSTFGASPESASALAGDHAALMPTLTVAGRQMVQVRKILGREMPADQDAGENAAVWQVVSQWDVWTQPA